MDIGASALLGAAGKGWYASSAVTLAALAADCFRTAAFAVLAAFAAVIVLTLFVLS